MTDAFDPAPAAALLAAAWQSGELLAELPAACRPRTLGDGYDIQDALVARLGDRAVGWKLGVGSRNGKAMTGVDRSLAGRVLAGRLFRSGDRVPMPNSAPVTVEFEIAFVLARDVAPGEKLADPLTVVAATHVAFEFVRARFVDRRTVGWPSFVADDAGFGALVLGPAVDRAAVADIASTLVVSADGREMAGAATGDDAIDPPQALAELFALARDRHITLAAGAIVSTGSLSRPFDIAVASTKIEARFAGGTLAATLAAPAR